MQDATYAVTFAGCVSACIHKQNLFSSKLSLGEMWASRGGRGTVLWSAWCAAKSACAETCWCGSTQCGAGAPWDGGILWRPFLRHCEATRAWISHIRWIGDKECNHVFIFSVASIGLIRVRTKRFRCNSNSKWFILYSFQFNISFAQTNLFELTKYLVRRNGVCCARVVQSTFSQLPDCSKNHLKFFQNT